MTGEESHRGATSSEKNDGHFCAACAMISGLKKSGTATSPPACKRVKWMFSYEFKAQNIDQLTFPDPLTIKESFAPPLTAYNRTLHASESNWGPERKEERYIIHLLWLPSHLGSGCFGNGFFVKMPQNGRWTCQSHAREGRGVMINCGARHFEAHQARRSLDPLKSQLSFNFKSKDACNICQRSGWIRVLGWIEFPLSS